MATRIDISTLTVQERFDLIESLWASIEVADVPPPSAELLAELERRAKQAMQDPAAATPWETVRARLRERLEE